MKRKESELHVHMMMMTMMIHMPISDDLASDMLQQMDMF